ncbi:hypothetical protein AT730_24040 (plasmid) [Vibrio alginolyticus]|nr:hypothetical protein AT730_24040 [Vibrio alginolyticus]
MFLIKNIEKPVEYENYFIYIKLQIGGNKTIRGRIDCIKAYLFNVQSPPFVQWRGLFFLSQKFSHARTLKHPIPYSFRMRELLTKFHAKKYPPKMTGI